MRNKKNSVQQMADAPVKTLILQYAAVTLSALLLNAVYTLTDALFVSWGVGSRAMGGVSVVFPFVILQGAIATALGGGAASIVSRKLGEGDLEEAGRTTISATAAFYMSALFLSLIGFLAMDPILHLMGVTGDLYADAKAYFTILLAGNVFSTGFSAIIRAEGRMTYSLLIWVIPISVNIALDALFILGLGWGVRGAALATVACQFVSFCMSILFFTRLSSQHMRGQRPNMRRIGEILAIGLPSLVQMGSLSIISMLLNNLLGNVSGSAGVTAYAYMSKVFALLIVPFTAMAQAVSPVVGFNHGAGKPERVHEAIRFSVWVCVLYSLAAVAIAELLPKQMLRLMTDDAQAILNGTNGLRIFALAIPFLPLPSLLGAEYQAMGEKTSALILYGANLVLLLPAAMLFSHIFGEDGIWWSYVLAALLTTLLAFIVMRVKAKNNKAAGGTGRSN
ncbi:MAG: MATE family efflux transporter [Eubacteriales bacterium]|nr:MATE family efflux transporter [Eubacteriales bacterium]